MASLKDYKIKFSGLTLGEHSFDYQMNNEFFGLFDYHEFEKSNLSAKVHLKKKPNGLDLQISINGEITIPCDISTDLYDQPIEAVTEVVVKFGDEFDDTNEAVLILPHGEYEFNIAQYLYELAVLTVPLKRVSLEALEGLKGKEIREKLEDLSPEREEETSDPRWDKLKNLLN